MDRNKCPLLLAARGVVALWSTEEQGRERGQELGLLVASDVVAVAHIGELTNVGLVVHLQEEALDAHPTLCPHPVGRRGVGGEGKRSATDTCLEPHTTSSSRSSVLLKVELPRYSLCSVHLLFPTLPPFWATAGGLSCRRFGFVTFICIYLSRYSLV